MVEINGKEVDTMTEDIENLTFETCPMSRIGELVARNTRKARKNNEQCIQRVLAALPTAASRAEFTAILDYYKSELGLSNYAADRTRNPQNY